MTTPILKPVRSVRLSDGSSVEVRELPWIESITLFNNVRAQIKSAVDEKGELHLDPAKVVEIISQNLELAERLIQKTTGKDAEWLRHEERSLGDALELLTTAVEINLEVIAEKIKNARSRLSALTTAGDPTRKSIPTSPLSATS